jgi:hypothetical protein
MKSLPKTVAENVITVSISSLCAIKEGSYPLHPTKCYALPFMF